MTRASAESRLHAVVFLQQMPVGQEVDKQMVDDFLVHPLTRFSGLSWLGAKQRLESLSQVMTSDERWSKNKTMSNYKNHCASECHKSRTIRFNQSNPTIWKLILMSDCWCSVWQCVWEFVRSLLRCDWDCDWAFSVQRKAHCRHKHAKDTHTVHRGTYIDTPRRYTDTTAHTFINMRSVDH